MMRISCKAVVCLLLIITPVFAQQPAPQKLVAREIAERTLPSVVLLMMSSDNGEKSFGSGFFVTPDVVVTNYHVIEGASSGLARINGQQAKREVAGIVAMDRERDLALLKLKSTVGKPLPIGDSNTVSIGDEIYAAGNPMGLEGTFSQGIISSVRKVEGEKIIQITAPISHGSSGGPVLNNQGQVIGVAFGSFVDGQALNFAVPTAYLRALMATHKPLMSFAQAAEAAEAAEAAPKEAVSVQTEVPTAPVMAAPRAPRSHAPSLDTDEAIDRKMPKVYIDARAVTKVSMTGKIMPHGQTATYTFTPEEGQFFVYAADVSHHGGLDLVSITYRTPTQNWMFEFDTSGLGQSLSLGTYTRCQGARSAFGRPGLSVTGQSTGCTTPGGSFTIYDLQIDHSSGVPRIISFAASFDHECVSSGGLAFKGVIYLNSVPLPGVH
jgi:hypothetical protein